MELVLTKLVLSVLHVLDSSACLAVVLTVVLRTNCLEYKKLTLFPNTTKLCDWVFRVCVIKMYHSVFLHMFGHPLRIWRATGTFAFTQAISLQELGMSMLNGVLIIWINPKMPTKIALNCDNGCFCIFYNTKRLLLFVCHHFGKKKNGTFAYMSRHKVFVRYDKKILLLL